MGININELYTHKAPQLKEENFKRMLLKEANTLLLKRNITTGYIVDENNQSIIEQLYQYIIGNQDKCRWNIHAGIIIAGPIGCGKTLLLDAFIRVSNQVCQKQIVRFHAQELVDYIKEHDINDIVKRPIAIDEIGREPEKINNFGHVIEPLKLIFARRYEYGARTFGTTNFKPEKLTEVYSEYITSRVYEMCNYIIMKGSNKRNNNIFI